MPFVLFESFVVKTSVGRSAQTLVGPNLTDISTVMREQLGLKMESVNGPVDVLVVESAQQPIPD